MHDSVTVHMAAAPDRVWGLVSDITNTGRFSPETLEAQWLNGATGPALGTRFRGHVKRNGRGPMYWTTCRITACEPGREFGFEVLVNGAPVNNWHYEFAPNGDGTDVTESFRLADRAFTRGYWALFGRLRGETNRNGMRETLHRIKAVAEAPVDEEDRMSEDAVTVVRRYLDALTRLDTDALFAELADDVVLELPVAPEGLPRRVEGKQAFIEFFGPVAAGLWTEIQFPTMEVRAEADPELVVAEYTSKGTFANGKPYLNTYVNLCRVRNGKIVESKEFFDPIALVAGLTP